jgi:hypothetical protein
MMATSQTFENAIAIKASVRTVEQCLVDRALMHQWLNPVLRCDPVGEIWDTDLGGETRFVIQLPWLEPALLSTVIEREPGLIVWGFEGFFAGCDRWECQPDTVGTRLLNRFEFSIPNPLVAFGFNRFAATWTQQDMVAQLQRLKAVAERLEQRR